MKKTVLTIAAVCVSLGLHATETFRSSYSLTLDFPYTTKYMFRGVELAKQSVQPSVELGSGGFNAGIWTNQPLVDNADNEVDFYAGYGFPLKGGWAIETGVCLYYYPELDKSYGGDGSTWEPYIGLTGSVAGFAPGVYLYYDLTLEVLTVEGQLGYSVALESVGSSLDFSANLGRVERESGSGYTYYSIGASVPFKISKGGTLKLGVNYAHNNISGTGNDHFWGTTGVTVRF